MAIIKISELPAADTPLSASDVVPALQNGVTKKAAINQFGFIADGTGATTRTIQNKLRDFVSIKDFGAVGDGVTDDTAAIQALANYLTSSEGAYVIWPKGTYYVARIGAPETVSFIFENCKSMTWEFEGGASISFKANFVHSLSLVSSKIVFRNCQNLNLINVETNGNVSTGTKVGTEQGEHGLSFFGCRGVALVNAKLHDHPNDGLYIDHIYSGGLISVASERFHVCNLDSYNNGRQGMSVIGLYNSVFENCYFRNTGNTGSFGFYSPGAGIDIEPNSTSELAVRDISLINPVSKGNIGSAFVCVNLASPSYPSIENTGNVDDVHVVNPYFEVGASATGADQVIFAVKNGSITNGKTNLTTGTIKLHRIVPMYSNFLSNVKITNHKVDGIDQCLLAVKDASRSIVQQKVSITGCEFVCKATSTNGGNVFVQISGGGEFQSNYVYVPGAAYSPGSTTRKILYARELDLVSGNIYDTDLSTASRQFTVDYTSSATVVDEIYKNPTYFWAFNDVGAPATALYGRGQSTAGMQLNIYDFGGTAGGNYVSRIFSSSTIPSSGTWQRGDVVLNSQPTSGNFIGWVCTASGTPGTWKTFGAIS